MTFSAEYSQLGAKPVLYDFYKSPSLFSLNQLPVNLAHNKVSNLRTHTYTNTRALRTTLLFSIVSKHFLQ